MNIEDARFEQPISNTQINLRIIFMIIAVQLFTTISTEIVLPDINPYLETLLDSFFLIIVSSPFIYFFIIKPFIISREHMVGELRDHQESFDEEVYSRTKELEKSRNTATTLLNSVTDAIINIDENQNVIMFNDNAKNCFGYKEDEIIGQPLLKLFPSKAKSNYNKKFQKYFDSVKFNGKLRLRGNIHAKRKNGEKLLVEIVMSRVSQEGKSLYSIIVNDISEREKYEQSLVKAKEQAERSDNSKSEFLANMTHELRTPMHSIVSFSALGLKKITSAPTEKLQQYFQSIHDSANRMLKLINGLLDISKLEANKMVLDYAATNLKLIAEQCVSEIQPQMNDKKLRCKLEVDQFVPVSLCDNSKIHQVILNLLSNSIRFSPESGLIRIKITAQMLAPKSNKGDAIPGIQMCVIDQGKGIQTDEQKTIFDKYVQSKKKENRVGGTGLGLAISKEIIELHNGHIWAESQEKGAVICFQIPINTKI